MVVVGEVDKRKEREEQIQDFKGNPRLFVQKLKTETLSIISLPNLKL